MIRWDLVIAATIGIPALTILAVLIADALRNPTVAPPTAEAIDKALTAGVCPIHPGKPADGSECTCTWPVYEAAYWAREADRLAVLETQHRGRP